MSKVVLDVSMSLDGFVKNAAVQETVVHPDRAALKATEVDTENHPTLQVIENTGQNCVAGRQGFEHAPHEPKASAGLN
jgi:hypothetical protein